MRQPSVSERISAQLSAPPFEPSGSYEGRDPYVVAGAKMSFSPDGPAPGRGLMLRCANILLLEAMGCARSPHDMQDNGRANS